MRSLALIFSVPKTNLTHPRSKFDISQLCSVSKGERQCSTHRLSHCHKLMIRTFTVALVPRAWFGCIHELGSVGGVLHLFCKGQTKRSTSVCRPNPRMILLTSPMGLGLGRSSISSWSMPSTVDFMECAYEILLSVSYNVDCILQAHTTHQHSSG